MTDPSEERHARYRAGLCIDCGVDRHSAGRPRCDQCEEVRKENLGKGVGW